MSLVVEVAGYALCNTSNPYSVLVICVQQENFQAWAVYRKYTQFQLLAEQLRALYPSIPILPASDQSDLTASTLEGLRVDMNKWLQVAGKSFAELSPIPGEPCLRFDFKSFTPATNSVTFSSLFSSLYLFIIY